MTSCGSRRWTWFSFELRLRISPHHPTLVSTMARCRSTLPRDPRPPRRQAPRPGGSAPSGKRAFGRKPCREGRSQERGLLICAAGLVQQADRAAAAEMSPSRQHRGEAEAARSAAAYWRPRPANVLGGLTAAYGMMVLDPPLRDSKAWGIKESGQGRAREDTIVAWSPRGPLDAAESLGFEIRVHEECSEGDHVCSQEGCRC